MRARKVATHIVIGNPDDRRAGYSRDDLLKNPHGTWTWTINKQAKPGDIAIWYLTSPDSAFVAIGTVAQMPKLETRGRWKDHHMADIKRVKPLPQPFKTRSEILECFPDWGWLKQPRLSTKIDERIAQPLLRLLTQANEIGAGETAPIPSAGAYQAALRKMKVSENEKQMLCTHYDAADQTATARQLAQTMQYKNYNAWNLQYGKLARRLCSVLGIERRVAVTILLITDLRTDDDHRLTLRPEVVQAIQQLGWVQPRKSPPSSDNSTESDTDSADLLAVDRSYGAGFSTDPARNKEVERAAIDFVTKHFTDMGWSVNSRESDKCGFDLECSMCDQILHVEVKGVSGEMLSFPITQNEVRQTEENSRFLLCVVTRALVAPVCYEWTGKDFLKEFERVPISFMAKRR